MVASGDRDAMDRPTVVAVGVCGAAETYTASVVRASVLEARVGERGSEGLGRVCRGVSR
jgi:hypothetical protein